jgi:hypothetical protein
MCPFYIHHIGEWDKEIKPCPRTHLTALSRDHKEVLDVSTEDYVPLMEQTKWKYLISTDGFSCSNRLVGAWMGCSRLNVLKT